MSVEHQLYGAAMSRTLTGVTAPVPTERDRMDEPHPGTSLAPRPPPAAVGHRRRVIAPYETRYQRWMKMWRAAG